jgi:hypothetical protein
VLVSAAALLAFMAREQRSLKQQSIACIWVSAQMPDPMPIKRFPIPRHRQLQKLRQLPRVSASAIFLTQMDSLEQAWAL